MKWPKQACVIQSQSAGSVRLDPGKPWADDAAVVREAPNLFADEPQVPLMGERPVENARNAPGAPGRITGVKRGR